MSWPSPEGNASESLCQIGREFRPADFGRTAQKRPPHSPPRCVCGGECGGAVSRDWELLNKGHPSQPCGALCGGPGAVGAVQQDSAQVLAPGSLRKAALDAGLPCPQKPSSKLRPLGPVFSYSGSISYKTPGESLSISRGITFLRQIRPASKISFSPNPQEQLRTQTPPANRCSSSHQSARDPSPDIRRTARDTALWPGPHPRTFYRPAPGPCAAAPHS